ncbi:MAG: alpha/beta hydrolase [Ramlibacter sp.]|nr:alpha/beta hydrolase [Ramlibacter sp.]
MTTASNSAMHGAPSLVLLALEPWRAGIDLAASFLSTRPRRIGDGHPVLVLPGLGGGDWSTVWLRRSLNRAGFATSGWGLGLNRGPEGDFDEWLARLDAKVQALHDRDGRKVSIIGWSLGGIYARELAKRVPHLVRQVVTLGSPFAGIKSSNAQTAFKLLNRGRAQPMTAELEQRLRTDPPVPATAIYSRTDGVVAWQSCMLNESAHAQNIEVSGSSHCGMGAHPQVLRAVVDRLAAV